MSWLIRTSLELRLLVMILAVVLVVVGIRNSDSVPLDVFPEFAPPLVEIQTEAPGISTEDVESLITVPIENAVNGIPFVQTVRSKSVLGLSSVRMIFEPGTDLFGGTTTRARAVGIGPSIVTPCCSSASHLATTVVAQSLFENWTLVRY